MESKASAILDLLLPFSSSELGDFKSSNSVQHTSDSLDLSRLSDKIPETWVKFNYGSRSHGIEKTFPGRSALDGLARELLTSATSERDAFPGAGLGAPPSARIVQSIAPHNRDFPDPWPRGMAWVQPLTSWAWGDAGALVCGRDLNIRGAGLIWLY